MSRFYFFAPTSWFLLALLGCDRPMTSIEYLERGIMLAQREQYLEAIKNLNRSIEIQPGNPSPYYERAVVYEQLKHVDLAIEDYSQAIRLNPEFVLSYLNRGRLYVKLGDVEWALTDFTRAIEFNPRLVAAYQARGSVYKERKLLENALSDFGRALSLEPNAHRYALRGNVFTQLDRYKDAMTDYDKAIELDATYAKAWLGRAIAAQKLGDARQARDNLRHAAQLDTDILADDILVSLQDIGAQSLDLALDAAAVTRTLSELGWVVQSNDSPMFPFVIHRENSDLKRLVCVGTLGEGRALSFPAEQYFRSLNEKKPRSLLVAIANGNGQPSWQFTEEWNLSDSQIRSETLLISIEGSATDSLAQAPAPE